MNLEIGYSKKANKFLEKNSKTITEKEVDTLIISAIKEIFKIEKTNIDLRRLKGKLKGYFRIKKGEIRIIFSLKKDRILKALINDIDFRGNIYK
ncbi:MAG: type II toxin-antitoxin system RelE/ParE family toxin [Candidatus Scalinduaceae bacterium]